MFAPCFDGDLLSVTICPLYWYAVLHSWCHNLTWISCICTVTSMRPATTLIGLFSTVDSSYAFPATYWIYRWEINNHCINIKNNNHCLKVMTHRCQQIPGGRVKKHEGQICSRKSKMSQYSICFYHGWNRIHIIYHTSLLYCPVPVWALWLLMCLPCHV